MNQLQPLIGDIENWKYHKESEGTPGYQNVALPGDTFKAKTLFTGRECVFFSVDHFRDGIPIDRSVFTQINNEFAFDFVTMSDRTFIRILKVVQNADGSKDLVTEAGEMTSLPAHFQPADHNDIKEFAERMDLFAVWLCKPTAIA